MKHNIWLYFPFGLMLSSLKMDNASRRTLKASVLMLTMSMLTGMVTLVVPLLLSGSPVKVMLKINTSEKNPETSYFCKRLSHVIPTGCTVKTELMSDLVLHLLPVHLLLLHRAVAGVAGATAGADLQTSGCKEAAIVNSFEVKRQIVHPW